MLICLWLLLFATMFMAAQDFFFKQFNNYLANEGRIVITCIVIVDDDYKISSLHISQTVCWFAILLL